MAELKTELKAELKGVQLERGRGGLDTFDYIHVLLLMTETVEGTIPMFGVRGRNGGPLKMGGDSHRGPRAVSGQKGELMEIAVILVAIFASSLGSFYLGLFIGRHLEPTKQQAWLNNFKKDMEKLTDPEGGQHG